MPYYINANMVSLEELKLRITDSDLVPSRRVLLEDIEIIFEKLEKYGIFSFNDLRLSVKNPKSIVQLSESTNISIEYLTLLRREVESYFPKTYKLSEFEGLERSQLAKLEKKGYKNAAMLYDFIEIPSNREDLISSIGLEEDFANEIFALIDLSRIQWVSPIFSRVLFNAGYNTVKSVAEANLEELHKSVEKANIKGQFFNGKVGTRDIARLIKSASYLF